MSRAPHRKKRTENCYRRVFPENHSTDRSTLGIGVDVAPIYNRFSDPARELIGGLTGNFVRQLCCPRQGKLLQMRWNLFSIS